MPGCDFGPYLSFVGYYAGWNVSRQQQEECQLDGAK